VVQQGDQQSLLARLLLVLPGWLREDYLQRPRTSLLRSLFNGVANLSDWLFSRPIRREKHRNRRPKKPDLRDDIMDFRRSPDERKRKQQGLSKLSRSYQPQPYPGKVVLLLARHRRLIDTLEADWGWGRFARGGLETHILPGDHFSLMRDPEHVNLLADRIRELLARHP
jgi:hypothetical protein